MEKFCDGKRALRPSKAVRDEARASRLMIADAVQTLQRSERGQRALNCLRAVLDSNTFTGLDAGGQNAVRILVGETLDGNRAWLDDLSSFSPSVERAKRRGRRMMDGIAGAPVNNAVNAYHHYLTTRKEGV